MQAFSKQHAAVYDQKAREAVWLDPHIVFGLAYEFVQPGESILDLGIGTGLSSSLFHKAGLLVHGMDASSHMLDTCRKKGMAASLVEHDLETVPYPYGDRTMDHAVCTGVMHLFAGLAPLFGEVGRILRPGGAFCFAVPHCSDGECAERAMENGERTWTMRLHSPQAVHGLLAAGGFEVVHTLNYMSASIGHSPVEYRACVAMRL